MTEAACTILIEELIHRLKRIERLTYKFGQIQINLRQSQLESLKLGNFSFTEKFCDRSG
ncbi:hypothetical protein PI95_014755 [Hassallia byssoidea VB512170]|uniref:Uncharacterized protein n=1 Tax=Hassallia byssoidea VB512170 TaxID=1304833 RepID=A0A846H855_9CYAN|nr:hypothetical protein [Hassalia byssoidea]NEU73787.1 hypothetical protein [Hassalia byssoidea VB512170]